MSQPSEFNPHDPDIDWTKAKKPEIKKGVKAGVLVGQFGNNSIAETLAAYWARVKDPKTGKLLSWAICKTKGCIISLTLKKNKSGGHSITTSTMIRHPHYKQWLAAHSVSVGLTNKEVFDYRNLLKIGAAKCIIIDFRPFSFTEGAGLFEYTKKCIEVGVKLEILPNDKDIKRIIPGRNANTRKVYKDHDEYRIKLLAHLEVVDAMVLPPFHLEYDFWEVPSNRNHMLGVIAREANWDTFGIDIYALELVEWEDLVGFEMEKTDGSSVYGSEASDGSYTETDEESSGDERDTEFKTDEESSGMYLQ